MELLDKIKTWAVSHKIYALAGVVILLVAVAAGGYFAWQQYQFRQSGQYAFEKIRGALNPPQPDQLAHLVDFNAICHEYAVAIARNFPFLMAGPDQTRNIVHALQKAMLAKFIGKDNSNKQFKNEETEEQKLQRTVEILPSDFVTQIYDKLRLQALTPDSALLSVKIDNADLGAPLTLVFNMQKTARGWIVNRAANAGEIVNQVKEALLARHTRLRDIFLEKNSATLKQMNALIPVQSCTADAGLISDGKILLMVVHIIARNVGKIQINNFNLDTIIKGKDGNVIARRLLNTAKPVAPGEDFSHRWNFELDSQSELAQNIMSGIPLQCQASWQTLGLGDSRVLHIVEVPNPDRACLIEGHDHPEGFCLSPVFLP